MADAVVLKSDTPAPTTGADKLPEAKVLESKGNTAQVTVDTTQVAKKPEQKPERPAWLPEGIESPEALAEAYKALKTQQAPKEDPKPPEAPKDAADTLQAAGLKMDEFTAEYAKDGKLSEASLAKLEKAGIPRATVDAYVEGQKALAASYKASLAQSVGGEEAMQATLKWAETALSPQEIAAANKALESMDAAQASLVLAGLNARRLADVGVEPKFASGRAAPSRDTQGYESTAQWIQDVNSKQYKTDPAFRELVSRRIKASKF